MVPGLGDILDYQLAAERLHELPFSVVTVTNTLVRACRLRVYHDHKVMELVGSDYEDVLHRAVQAFIEITRTDRPWEYSRSGLP